MIDNEYSNLVTHLAPNGSNLNLNKKTIGEKIYDWNFAGIPIMLALITLLQYLFELSNQSTLVGMFAPVSDNISEILKQAFWAMVIYSAIEYTTIKKHVNNYLVAKLSGLVVFVITIVTVHYTLDLLFGFNNFILSAIPFISGAALCQAVTFSVYRKPSYKLIFTRISVATIILIAASFEVSSINDIRNSLLSISNIHISQNTFVSK